MEVVGLKSSERKYSFISKKYSKITDIYIEINRVLVTVLRESLLKQMDNGTFRSNKLKR